MKKMTWIKMKNIVLIIPNIFKMFLISNYKLRQAPNTKNSKKNTSGEREQLLCGVWV
jgi:hypothetical protein